LTEIGKMKGMGSSWNSTDPDSAGPDSSDRDSTGPGGRKPSSFGIRELLFAVLLAAIFFLLGHDMVRHRFFQGGRYHRNGSVGQ